MTKRMTKVRFAQLKIYHQSRGIGGPTHDETTELFDEIIAAWADLDASPGPSQRWGDQSVHAWDTVDPDRPDPREAARKAFFHIVEGRGGLSRTAEALDAAITAYIAAEEKNTHE
tara:strand:+ start:321 stop:665 length:345 start_codon:yes stop_codon:yes gene_type:complete